MAEENHTPEAQTKLTITEGESKILACIMKHLTGDIQFDADAVAVELNYKNTATLKTRWGQIKKKILEANGGPPMSPAGVAKRTPKKGGATPNKRKAVDDEVVDDNEAPDTPIKTPKKRGRPSKADKAKMEAELKAESEADDIKEDEDEAEVKNEEKSDDGQQAMAF